MPPSAWGLYPFILLPAIYENVCLLKLLTNIVNYKTFSCFPTWQVKNTDLICSSLMNKMSIFKDMFKKHLCVSFSVNFFVYSFAHFCYLVIGPFFESLFQGSKLNCARTDCEWYANWINVVTSLAISTHISLTDPYPGVPEKEYFLCNFFFCGQMLSCLFLFCAFFTKTFLMQNLHL